MSRSSPLDIPWDALLQLVEEAAANRDRRAQFSLPLLIEREQANQAAGLPPDHNTAIQRLACYSLLNPDLHRPEEKPSER